MFLRHSTLAVLASATKDGFDPFDIGEARAADIVYHEEDPDHRETSARVLRMIVTPTTDERRRFAEALRDSLTTLHRIDAEIALHLGIDPLGLLVAYEATTVTRISEFAIDQGPSITDGELVHLWAGDDARPMVNAALSPLATWHHGSVVIRGLPEAAATAMVGRPLRRSVSHPVLDRHDLVVANLLPHVAGHLLEVGVGEDRLDAAALIREFTAPS